VFLAIAKNTNRYLALSKQMLRKAFAACESMKHFSINLGKEEIKSPEIWTLLETLILRHNAQGRVVFEILEHDYFEDTEEVSHFVNHFKKLGVKIAIDDFGSGYSSFRRVLGLRPHILKIDGNIIRDLPHSPDNKKLVELIVEFARSMGIKTVAEFVENEEIFHEARMLGIDYFQGYHFGRPRSCEEIS
ncbi:EAL domain-containing protein, partial [Nitratifractor sp.]